MRWLRFAVILSLVTVLQASLLAELNIKPDLLLVLLVFFAVYSSTTDAIIISFVIGVTADLIGYAMGPKIISFVLLGTSLAYLHRVIAIRKMSYQALALFTIGFLSALLVHLLAWLKGQQTPLNTYISLLGTPLCSAIVGPFLFLPLAWWMRIKTHRFSKQ